MGFYSLANLLILLWSIVARYWPAILWRPSAERQNKTDPTLRFCCSSLCAAVTSRVRISHTRVCHRSEGASGWGLGGFQAVMPSLWRHSALWFWFFCLLSCRLVIVRAMCTTPAALQLCSNAHGSADKTIRLQWVYVAYFLYFRVQTWWTQTCATLELVLSFCWWVYTN